MRTFGARVPDLSALRAWLETHGVTHVAMESTAGVYWKPVFYVLEVRYEGIVSSRAGRGASPLTENTSP